MSSFTMATNMLGVRVFFAMIVAALACWIRDGYIVSCLSTISYPMRACGILLNAMKI